MALPSLDTFHKQYFRLKQTSPHFVFCEVRELIEMLPSIDFDVWLPTQNKNLQRNFVWSLEQMQALIWSILMDRKIPPICVVRSDSETKARNEIIDGKQRLISTIDFLQNKFAINYEGENYRFKDLPIDYQNKILRYNINAQTIFSFEDEPITDKEKEDWFNFINFAGTPHLK